MRKFAEPRRPSFPLLHCSRVSAIKTKQSQYPPAGLSIAVRIAIQRAYRSLYLVNAASGIEQKELAVLFFPPPLISSAVCATLPLLFGKCRLFSFQVGLSKSDAEVMTARI